MSILVIIPTLNEAAHIEGLLRQLEPFARRQDARIVVADGGSSDATVAIAQRGAAGSDRIAVIHNPGRTQAAAVNLAVRGMAGGAEWLIRIDAHSTYPDDYCDTLLVESVRTGADSVVVAMRAVGEGWLHAAIADAQNSRIGNGGAAHRRGGAGRWVDHGHHALMRIPAFREVAGYDEDFTHNEDAELDHRLRAAGFRIWMTAETVVDYIPRRSMGPLLRQYYRFGRGRAKTLAKHRMRPAPRQLAVSALAPALSLAVLTPLSVGFAVPGMVWLAGCIAGGTAIAVERRTPRGLLSGLIAGGMHLAWSAGFWRERIRPAGVTP